MLKLFWRLIPHLHRWCIEKKGHLQHGAFGITLITTTRAHCRRCGRKRNLHQRHQWYPNTAGKKLAEALRTFLNKHRP
jgi:hypothetical protein